MRRHREEFRTHRGYNLEARKEDCLTPSMEDYLEMICRLAPEDGHTRVKDLATALNVKPPSVTGMIQRLRDKGLISYQRYGAITLTEDGRRVGESLLRRHRMLEFFFWAIGVRGSILENVERIEHNLTPEATRRLAQLVSFIRENPAWLREFQEHAASSGDPED